MNQDAIYSLLKEKKSSELIDELKRDPALLKFSDDKGVSLLALGFYFGNTEITDYILSQRDPKDIFEAAISGRVDLVDQYLNENPLDLNSTSPDGFSPLGFSCYFGREHVARFLLQKGAKVNQASANPLKVTPLHSAVASNNFEITELLLRHGANPNPKQQNDVTPLHSAAHNGNERIVKLLLQSGADLKAKMDNGKTPYDLATEKNAQSVMLILNDKD
jgi:uncharacterized protein